MMKNWRGVNICVGNLFDIDGNVLVFFIYIIFIEYFIIIVLIKINIGVSLRYKGYLIYYNII